MGAVMYRQGACKGCEARRKWLQQKHDRLARAIQSVVKTPKGKK